MNTPAVYPVSTATVVRLGRLAPLASLLGLFYLGMAALCALGAYSVISGDLATQRSRVIYEIAIFASLCILFSLSSLRTFEAARALSELRDQSVPALERALVKLREMLLLFFCWLLALIVLGVVGLMLPVY